IGIGARFVRRTGDAEEDRRAQERASRGGRAAWTARLSLTIPMLGFLIVTLALYSGLNRVAAPLLPENTPYASVINVPFRFSDLFDPLTQKKELSELEQKVGIQERRHSALFHESWLLHLKDFETNADRNYRIRLDALGKRLQAAGADPRVDPPSAALR